MNKTENQSNEDGPAETLAVAAGSAAFLRTEADRYERISTYFGTQLDREEIEHVARLRNAAAELDNYAEAIRALRAALVEYHVSASTGRTNAYQVGVGRAFDMAEAILPNT